MAKNNSGFGCLTLLIVAIIAHSCGVDEGRQAEHRKAQTEIDTLESKNRQLEQELETAKRSGARCPQAEEAPHIAR